MISGFRAALGQKFADRPALAFGARAVVAPDIEDERVVADSEPVEFVDQAPGLRVGVLGVAGEDFHQSPLEGLFVLGDILPGGERLRPRRQFGVGRDVPQFLLSREDALAHGVPAIVELAFVLVRPFLEDVMRCMDAARRPIHEERLVGRQSALLAHPGNPLVGQVLGQVVALALRGLDAVGVFHERGFPLRGLACQETVEIVEADKPAGRPSLEGADLRGVGVRRVVPLAEGRGGVAVVAEHLGDRCAGGRRHARVAVPVVGEARDLPCADAVMVLSRQESGARGRTHRRRMKAIERNAGICDAAQRRRLDVAAVGARQRWTGVVNQDDDDVRRVGRQPLRYRQRMIGRFPHGPRCRAA